MVIYIVAILQMIIDLIALQQFAILKVMIRYIQMIQAMTMIHTIMVKHRIADFSLVLEEKNYQILLSIKVVVVKVKRRIAAHVKVLW